MINPSNKYTCRYCGLNFRLKSAFWNHIKQSHKIDLEVDFKTIKTSYGSIMEIMGRER